MTVEKIPVDYTRPKILTGKEIWAVPEPPSEMVWEICPYLRMDSKHEGCRQCPQFEDHEHYGQCQRGCYGLAEEACRVVFAMQKKLDQ